MKLTEWRHIQVRRTYEFPVVKERTFLAHAGVTALPRRTSEAIRNFADQGTKDQQEGDWVWPLVTETRKAVAQLLQCDSMEIALLGPTSLGLNLVANGLTWHPGDEVIYYADDYPANVYPWLKLKRLGVKPVPLRPECPGLITWEIIEDLVTESTKLVALASCHFLSGYRIDIDKIGQQLHKRGILFSLDGIQTLGAFPVSVEHVDFLSADSHKWLLGPVGAGIFYVKSFCMDLLNPTLLGARNVISPEFIAQEEIAFYGGARRYEPGSLNVPGILGMLESIKLLLDLGIENVEKRILDLRQYVLDIALPLGYQHYENGNSGIISLTHPTYDMQALWKKLGENKISVSLRKNRQAQTFIRLSPHFYNTEEEIDRVINVFN